MKRARIILIAALVAALLVRLGLAVFYPKEHVDESLYIEEIVPGVLFSSKSGTPPHYSSRQGVVAFNTYDVTPGIRGYAGPIRLLLAIDAQGRIAGIRILEHEETPNYVHGMETTGFLGQFLGKSINDPLEIDRDIDGVSRATVSVKALAETVRESSRKVASGVMGLEVRGAERKAALSLKWMAYTSLLAIALAMYYLTRRKRLPNFVRDIFLAASIGVVGVWLATPFSVLHVFNLALGRFSTDALWLAIVPGTLLTIALAGRFYCGWLCPFGAISEFLCRIPLRKWSVPADMDDRWRNVKYYVLALVMLAVVPTGKTDLGNYETYVTLFSMHGTYLMWAVVGVSLLASLRIKRFWCRFLCPVAAIAGAASREDRRYVSSADCPMDNRPAPLIAECVRCNRCYKGVQKK